MSHEKGTTARTGCLYVPAGVVRESLHLRRMKMKRNSFGIGFAGMVLATGMMFIGCASAAKTVDSTGVTSYSRTS